MAKTARTALDTDGWDAAFAALAGPVRESLARTMAVEGGQLLRDAAKANARITYANSAWEYNERSRGSQSATTLAEAIYLARNAKQSTGDVFVYSVSWSNTQAWWGKLREFGYMMRYQVYKDANNVYHTLKDRPLANPKPMPAHPFLAPAYDANIGRLADVMVTKGRNELPRIIAEHTNAGS